MRDDYIIHYNVKGAKWYTHKYGNWERHANYANGQPNPETAGEYLKVPMNVTKKDIAIKYFGQMLGDVSSEVKNKVLNIDKKTGFRKKYLPTSREDDMAKVNPLFNTKLPDTSRNCIYCTTAYEMRRRGYDVQAKENKTDSTGIYATSITRCFPGSKIVDVANAEDVLKTKGKLSSYAYNTGVYNPIVKKTIKTLESQGEGARGTLLVLWKSGWGGHALSYEISDGKLNIIDSQSNKLYDKSREVNGILKGCSDSKYVRLDNVEFDPDKIKEAVK